MENLKESKNKTGPFFLGEELFSSSCIMRVGALLQLWAGVLHSKYNIS